MHSAPGVLITTPTSVGVGIGDGTEEGVGAVICGKRDRNGWDFGRCHQEMGLCEMDICDTPYR